MRNVSLALRSIIRFGKYGQLSRVSNAKLNCSEIKNVCAQEATGKKYLDRKTIQTEVEISWSARKITQGGYAAKF